jgi:hypothetical protein
MKLKVFHSTFKTDSSARSSLGMTDASCFPNATDNGIPTDRRERWNLCCLTITEIAVKQITRLVPHSE